MAKGRYLVTCGDSGEWYKYDAADASDAVKQYMEGDALDLDAEYQVVGPIEPTVFKVGPYVVEASK